MRTTLGFLVIAVTAMLAVDGHPAREAVWSRAEVEKLVADTKRIFCRGESSCGHPVMNLDVEVMLNRHAALLGPALSISDVDAHAGMQRLEEQERRKWEPVANATWNVLVMYLQGIDVKTDAAFQSVGWLFRAAGTGAYEASEAFMTFRELVPVWPEVVYDPWTLTPLVGFQFQAPMPGLVRALQDRIVHAGLRYSSWSLTLHVPGTTLVVPGLVLAVVC